jgi:1-acyl-sn-glycerol-3-phosphate acyltransferase
MLLLIVILLYVVVRIVTIGHDFSKDQPIRGWFRNKALGYMYKAAGTIILFFVGVRSSYDVRDYDYTYFLGPNYKETTAYPKYFSTYVSNHTSWLDIILLI